MVSWSPFTLSCESRCEKTVNISSTPSSQCKLDDRWSAVVTGIRQPYNGAACAILGILVGAPVAERDRWPLITRSGELVFDV